MLQESGLVPFEATPGKRRAKIAFSAPAKAEVRDPAQQEGAPSDAGHPMHHRTVVVRRKDAENQRLYDVSTPVISLQGILIPVRGCPAMQDVGFVRVLKNRPALSCYCRHWHRCCLV